MRTAGAIAAALVLAGPAHAGDEAVRSRFTTGLDWARSSATGDAVYGGLIDERLRAEVFDGTTTGTLFVAGRLRYRLSDTRWGESRLRDARLHLQNPNWEADFGRIPVDGGFRIIDGVQALATTGRWQLGAFGGAAADPYTTLPAGRFGGGPVVRYRSDVLTFEGLSEILFTADGLDRASAVASAQLDPSPNVDLSTRLDLQYGGPTQPLSVADAAVFLWARPVPTVRIDALYDGYSSYRYLFSEKQDPGVSRFSQRILALDPEQNTANDVVDPTMYHLLGGGVRWSTDDSPLDLRTRLRYRYHPLPERRYSRFTLHQGLVGIAAGRLDLALEESVLWWGGSRGWDALALAWFEPFPDLGLAFDTSVQVGLKPLVEDPSVLGSYLYADGFVDFLGKDAKWALAGGYGYTRVMDLGLWDQQHAALLRLSWNVRAQRREER